MANEADAIILNQSGLPNEQVRRVVAERWVDIAESAAFTGGGLGSFTPRQSTARNLFVRSDYLSPTNVIEEMELALKLYEEDDDVQATVDMMAALMFSGMKNLHSDEDTLFKFNGIAANASLDIKLRELATGLLTTGQVYPVKIFSRTQLPNYKSGRNPSLVMPNVIFLHSMTVRVSDIDGAGEPVLVQEVDDRTHQFLLAIGKGEERPTAAQQVKRSDNPIAAALYTEQFVPDRALHGDDPTLSGLKQAWYLNPRMVRRYTINSNSGMSKYAPVPIKRVFGLCEAKRLLNLMDYGLLNGAINFLIVVRKGTDQIPAVQSEVDNLQGLVQRAARTGVLIGDHRLSVDIIMPSMEALLDPSKRDLLGRKIAKSLMRMPDLEWGRVEGGGTPEAEIATQVMMSDRRIIKRQIEHDIYSEVILRNGSEFRKGPPKLYFPRIILSGAHEFTDFILKLRDRGDIPRSWAVEAAGFDPDAALAERQREIDAGWDETMTAQNVPSTGDNPMNDGRPKRVDGGGDGDTNNDPINNPNGDA